MGKLLFLPPPRNREDPRGVLLVFVVAALVALLSMGLLLVVGRPGVPTPPPAAALP